jgi:hypothetical protein
MLTGQMLGTLNQIVSDIAAGDSESETKEIHIGLINPTFQEYIDESVKREAIVLICEINGIPVFANSKCGTMIFAVKNGESWRDQIKENVTIDGIKPSKTWIRNNLNYYTKKGVKHE